MTTVALLAIVGAIVVPLAAGGAVLACRRAASAQRIALAATAAAFLLTLFAPLARLAAPPSPLPGGPTLASLPACGEAIVVDRLNAPLLPMAALLFLVTTVATLKSKSRQVPFTWLLVSESLMLALFACRSPWGVIGWLILQPLPPYFELRAGKKSRRLFLVALLCSSLCLAAGGVALYAGPANGLRSAAGSWLIAAGVMMRAGVFPFHLWIADLFERATFGTGLLLVAPMPAAYATMRLLVPTAPDAVLHTVQLCGLATAVYAAALSLAQYDARRLFACLLVSHSMLVLAGLDPRHAVGLTGSLSLWLSASLALAGFGLTMRALESRVGRLTLHTPQGFQNHTPLLAAFFLMMGLASIGFPGTAGFVGAELLVEGAVEAAPWRGALVVLAMALNGIAIVHAYFQLFGGRPMQASISLRARPPERLAVWTLAVLVLAAGLWPQPVVLSRFQAAIECLNIRAAEEGGVGPFPVCPAAVSPHNGVPAGFPTAGHPGR